MGIFGAMRIFLLIPNPTNIIPICIEMLFFSFPFPWKSHGTPIPMADPIPMQMNDGIVDVEKCQ